jgi:copper homeostasis protein
MQPITFELCAENIEACLAAHAGGADRIELCAALNRGGLTPSHGLICDAVRKSGLPIHVLLRPREGDFIYTAAEFEVMYEDMKHARSLGASGVVLGLLNIDGTVDVERTREIVEMSGSLEVTFHRAFDYAASREQALEDVIAAGCRRILTSGGERDLIRGAGSVARLVKQADGRIGIAVGGGLRLNNAAAVARATGARHFHGSVRQRVASPVIYKDSRALKEEGFSSETRFIVDSNDVRQIIENLKNA